jgi:hypothetical protein
MPMYGQSSGDFKETSGRIQLFHIVTRNSVGALAADAFTQLNPALITTAANKSQTLVGITKVGVLGGSIAFTRNSGNNLIGGPVGTPAADSGALSITGDTGVKPLGFFINDAVGNAFENTPGPASGRGPYVCGSGSCIGLTIYETQTQASGGAGLTWAVGDYVYASVNGLATNLLAQAYEYVAGLTTYPSPTVLGVVKAVPNADTPMLVMDLRI